MRLNCNCNNYLLDFILSSRIGLDTYLIEKGLARKQAANREEMNKASIQSCIRNTTQCAIRTTVFQDQIQV